MQLRAVDLGDGTGSERLDLERGEQLGRRSAQFGFDERVRHPGGSAGTAACSCSSSCGTSAPTMSGRRLSIWPNFTHVVPSSTRTARRRSPSVRPKKALVGRPTQQRSEHAYVVRSLGPGHPARQAIPGQDLSDAMQSVAVTHECDSQIVHGSAPPSHTARRVARSTSAWCVRAATMPAPVRDREGEHPRAIRGRATTHDASAPRGSWSLLTERLRRGHPRLPQRRRDPSA